MANSVDPDQTPRSAASDLGLHCLLRPICPNRVFTVYDGIIIAFIALSERDDRINILLISPPKHIL